MRKNYKMSADFLNMYFSNPESLNKLFNDMTTHLIILSLLFGLKRENTVSYGTT